MGIFGPPDVAKLSSRRDIKGLVKALKYPEDPRVPGHAAEVLGRIGDARAVDPLVAALRGSDESTRRPAMWALGRISDARAVEPLVAALRDSDRSVRVSAVDALDELGWKPDIGEDGAWYWADKGNYGRCAAIGAAAIEPLLAALKDDDSYGGRRTIKEALDALDWTPSLESIMG